MNAVWQEKSLGNLSEEEWESLCTHCGKCCLFKLEDEASGQLCYTDIVCRYFDKTSGRCREYADRCKLVPECLKLTPQNVGQLQWMPLDCAYRIFYETGTLPDWHPLITGKPLAAEHTVCARCVSELDVREQDWEDHIIEDETL